MDGLSFSFSLGLFYLYPVSFWLSIEMAQKDSPILRWTQSYMETSKLGFSHIGPWVLYHPDILFLLGRVEPFNWLSYLPFLFLLRLMQVFPQAASIWPVLGSFKLVPRWPSALLWVQYLLKRHNIRYQSASSWYLDSQSSLPSLFAVDLIGKFLCWAG